MPATAAGQIRRVAVLAMDFSPLDLAGIHPAGGVNIWVPAVTHELACAGVECHIFVRATSSQQPRMVRLEPGVWLVHVPAGPLMPLPTAELPALVEVFCRNLRQLVHAQRCGPFDIISAHGRLSGLAALKLRGCWKVPVVFRSHALALERNATVTSGEPPWPPDRVRDEATIIAEADLLVAASDSERRDLVERYAAVPDKIRVIASGVDHERFHPADRQRARDRLGSTAAHLLVCVGRLHRIKGIDLAVDVVAELSRREPDLDVELLVVGGSPNQHRQQVAELRNRVNWQATAGRVSLAPACAHRTLPTVYQAADLLIMPSRTETFGMVALEAQACGTPVIGARVGSLPEVVNHGITGVLLAERDPAVYATVISDLLLNQSGRLRAMRIAAYEHASRFHWRSTATGLLAAYHEAHAR